MIKLRIATPSTDAGCPPGLMLSPDGRDWCSVDGGSAGGRLRPAAVVLTSSLHDRVSPLLDLRHGEPLNLYATPAVFEHLTLALPVLPVLQQYCGVCWHLLAVAGEQQEASFLIDAWPQWSFTALHMQCPPDSPQHGDQPQHNLHKAGSSIALSVRDTTTGQHLIVLPFVPGYAKDFDEACGQADCVLVIDGAALDDDSRHAELSWTRFRAFPARRKLLVDRPQINAAVARRHGVEIVQSGMALDL